MFAARLRDKRGLLHVELLRVQLLPLALQQLPLFEDR